MEPSARIEERAQETADEIVETAPRRLEIDISLETVLKVVAVALSLWLLHRLANVILVVAVSLMLVATFNPLVRMLQSRYGRTGALSIVIVGIICIVALPLGLVLPILVAQGSNLVASLPAYAQNLQVLLGRHGMHVNLQQGVQDAVTSMAQGIPQVFGLLSNVVHHLVGLASILVLTIYLLIEGPEVAQALLRLLPRARRLAVRRVCADVGLQVGAYMRGQLILSTLAGAFFLCLLLVLRVPNALALALVAGVADAIPMAGLIIALVPACLSALSMSSVTAGAVAGVYLAYHQVELNILAPRIFGSALGLQVSVVVVAILVGVELIGILGAVLALPVAAALPTVVRYLAALHEEVVVASEQPT